MCLSLSFLLTIVMFRGLAFDMPYEEIFKWVASELKIEKYYPMPQIFVVSREELQKLLRKDNQKSYARWIEEYGGDEAKKTMDTYLKGVIGLFNPKTKVIHVESFIKPCNFDSIVAHEMTHYLQVMEEGEKDSQESGFIEVHFFREMQAYNIGEKYTETICAQPNTATKKWHQIIDLRHKLKFPASFYLKALLSRGKPGLLGQTASFGILSCASRRPFRPLFH
ncbi:MAG: hypothetical protein QGG48_09360 [Desulfatiglandales bacterium]|nr:hypothetical protein [Desulfatiglandales bacterium]